MLVSAQLSFIAVFSNPGGIYVLMFHDGKMKFH